MSEKPYKLKVFDASNGPLHTRAVVEVVNLDAARENIVQIESLLEVFDSSRLCIVCRDVFSSSPVFVGTNDGLLNLAKIGGLS